MSDSRKDLPSVNSNNFLSRVRETLQGYLGTNGNVMDRGVTVRDLADSGIVRVNPTFLSNGVGSPIIGAGTAVGTGGTTTTVVVGGGGGSTPEYVPDLTKPPAPTGFFVGAGLTQLQGGIAAPAYTEGHGHGRSILYGVTYSGTGDLPTFSSAVELTRFTGSIFGYPTTPATTWHLWVTHVSKDGRESDPTGGLHGLTATTGQDVPYIVTALSGLIGYDQFTTGFANSFDTVAATAGEAYDNASAALGNAATAQGTADAATTSVNWLAGRYTVRTTVSVDGKTLVGGFSLSGTSAGTQGAEIEFGVAANRFWIGAPQTEGVTAVPSVKPFVVQTVDTVTPNGVTIPKGVYMDAAFIMNLEAAVARLGTAWIKTAMVANAQIVDAHVANLNAEKITAGLLAAERIDGRELTIRNAEGDVLLDASGDAVPPWVVQEDVGSIANTGDPGSVQWAKPPDQSNKSYLRSLLVDGVALKAAVSESGNSVKLESAARDVWHVTYAADFSLYPTDGMVPLSYGFFTMAPNTTYMLTMSFATRIIDDLGTPSVALYLSLPPGCSVRAGAGGSTTTLGAYRDDVAVGSFTPPASDTTGWPGGETRYVYLKTGPAGGAFNIKAMASQVNIAIGEGTTFSLARINNFKAPEQGYSPSAPVFPLAGDQPVTTIPTTGTVTCTVQAGPPRKVLVSMVTYGGKTINARAYLKAAYDPVNQRFVLSYEGFVHAVYGYSPTTGGGGDGNFAFALVNSVPSAESGQWSFVFDTVVVASSWVSLSESIGTGGSSLELDWGGSYILDGSEPSRGELTLEVTVTPQYRGLAQGTPWTVQIYVNTY